MINLQVIDMENHVQFLVAFIGYFVSVAFLSFKVGAGMRMFKLSVNEVTET